MLFAENDAGSGERDEGPEAMKKPTRAKPRSNSTKKFVKRIVKESIAEVLATAPKGAWKSWPQLWEEAGKP